MRFGPELTCRELTGFLADYLAGGLVLSERAVFEAHLAECPDCTTYLRTYARTVQLAKDAHAETPDQVDVPEALVRAIVAARPRAGK